MLWMRTREIRRKQLLNEFEEIRETGIWRRKH